MPISFEMFKQLFLSIDAINAIDPKYLTKETFAEDVPIDLIEQWIVYKQEKEKLREKLEEYNIYWID